MWWTHFDSTPHLFWHFKKNVNFIIHFNIKITVIILFCIALYTVLYSYENFNIVLFNLRLTHTIVRHPIADITFVLGCRYNIHSSETAVRNNYSHFIYNTCLAYQNYLL